MKYTKSLLVGITMVSGALMLTSCNDSTFHQSNEITKVTYTCPTGDSDTTVYLGGDYTGISSTVNQNVGTSCKITFTCKPGYAMPAIAAGLPTDKTNGYDGWLPSDQEFNQTGDDGFSIGYAAGDTDKKDYTETLDSSIAYMNYASNVTAATCYPVNS